MTRARLRLVLLLGVLALAAGVPQAASPAEVPQDFIVVLDDSFTGSVPAVAEEHARASNGRVGFIFEDALKGFVLRISPAAVEQLIARDHRIAFVEPDAPVEAYVTQSPVTWGLDRIDQRNRPLS